MPMVSFFFCIFEYMYTFSKLIKKAKEIHGDKYVYDESTYVKVTEKMKIICPVHGEFWQSMHCHIGKRQGCPKCGKEKPRKKFTHRGKITSEDFIELCREKFGDKFQYELSNFKNVLSEIKVICPEHGETIQKAIVHLNSKYGCPQCANAAISKNNLYTTEEFIRKAKEIHGDKYDYSKVKYVNIQTPVTIICKIHGEFKQTPTNHLTGCGCQKCAIERTNIANRSNIEEFIEKANKIHNFKYDYTEAEYGGNQIKMAIKCPIHGVFLQDPSHHLQGEGCPKCGNQLSNAENDIYNFCCDILGKENVIQHENFTIRPYQIDVYIPSLKIGIEYNGLYWHGEKFGKGKNYHLNKTLACEKKGIRLIQIFEDEYLNHKKIVFSKLKHIFQKDYDLSKIYARKCIVTEIKRKDAAAFLEENHIQGSANSTVYLGCFNNEKLVSVMSFKRTKNKWELTRYASDINMRCVGVAGKMLSYFIKNYHPKEIKSFADRRWTSLNSNLYDEIGFKQDSILSPDYRYYKREDGPNRFHKFGFRKKLLHNKYNLPLTMTENEMVNQLGYQKIWDCGLIKYIYKIKEG